MIQASLRWLGIVVCLCWLPAYSQSQVDLFEVFVKEPRLAVLPFANLTDYPEVTPEVMAQIRAELQDLSIELADSNSTADILRKYRIRNTDELTARQVQLLSEELVVGYLLVGTIDRYWQSETSAEVALSARLLYAPSVSIEWSSSATAHTDDYFTPLSIGRVEHAEHLTRRAINKLFTDFRKHHSQRKRSVLSIQTRSKSPPSNPPCRRILLLPFANDTETRFAGHIFSNQVLSALYRFGFEIIDPGRVREVMLAKREFLRGEISSTLLAEFQSELGADFILTGTVSRFKTTLSPQSLDEPTVAFEARLVDTQHGGVVWAESFAREGKDSAWLFHIGSVHGLGALSNIMARKLAKAIPVVRSRSGEAKTG